MTIEYIGKFLMVMGLMIVVDACWAKYTLAMQRKDAMVSGLWSVGIMLCGALVTVNYVGDKTMLVPAAIGAFLGTFFAVRHSSKNKSP